MRFPGTLTARRAAQRQGAQVNAAIVGSASAAAQAAQDLAAIETGTGESITNLQTSVDTLTISVTDINTRLTNVENEVNPP